MTINWRQIAYNIRRARIAAGMPRQKDLAARLGISSQSIGSIETGYRIERLTIARLAEIAEACGVTMADLLDQTERGPVPRPLPKGVRRPYNVRKPYTRRFGDEPSDEELDRMALRMMGAEQ